MASQAPWWDVIKETFQIHRLLCGAALMMLMGIGTGIASLAEHSSLGPPESLPLRSPSKLSVARTGAEIVVAFEGMLQAADQASGPWLDLFQATSPLHLDATNHQQFYRVRETNAGSIFASRTPIAGTLTGPFQAHFDLAYAGMPDGIFPPLREKPWFDAYLQMAGFDLPVSARVRGNSSLQECPFPKLKFKVSKENRPGTPFEEAREVKIGTHCAEGGRGPIGRLRDQSAAYREVVAYEIMELLEFVAPRTRRVHLEYRDTTSSTNAGATVGWIINRDAFFHEDIEVVAERLGGVVLEDMTQITLLTAGSFESQIITDLLLLNALLGNWDYRLPIDGPGLWNIEVIELSDKTLIPVAGDFDLASWVTGVVRSSAPHDYHPEMAEVERQARYEIEQIQQQVSAASFLSGSNRFALKQSILESHVEASQVDEAGRTNMLRHLEAFYDALSRSNSKE